MIRRHASWVVASGFSQKTGLPASIAASTYSSWVGPQEQTMIASTSSDLINSWPVEYAAAPGTPSATLLASSRLTSVTATTFDPASTVVNRRMWSFPIMPTPMTPTFTVIASPQDYCPARHSIGTPRAGQLCLGPPCGQGALVWV